MEWWIWLLLVVAVVLVLVAIYDVVQKRHSILRNYPVVGHLRFWLESVGPELRQYIVTDNDEELPFSRDQRRWVYASAKGENSYFGFGTDNDLDRAGYPFFHQSAFPLEIEPGKAVGVAKTIGELHDRPHAFQPNSIVAISAMSFGALSSAAITALNKGAAMAGALHNTGEGGISAHHCQGGDLIFQIGTGYFGARDKQGNFSIDAMLESIGDNPVRAIEIKLSQGAKPGLGGVLPAPKVTHAIAQARGVPVGVTVHSPARHREFSDITKMVEFVERVAGATGLPVGIKSAVGDGAFWDELAAHMASTGRGPDYIAVDGAEGGTGAAPLVFADHVARPIRQGFPLVYRAFAQHGLEKQLTFSAAGRLGFAPDAALLLAMGADMIAVAREPMLALGCIQAQECHTGHCPTGVATQKPRLVRGLDPTDKSVRVANYIRSLQHDLATLAHAMGHEHPSRIRIDQISVSDGQGRSVPAADWY